MRKYTNEAYLRAEHLLVGGKYVSPTLEIADVIEGAPLMRKQKSYPGLALVFKDKEKVLGLGITNESLLAVISGDASPDKWPGMTVHLEVREVQSPTGGTEPAIRIMPPKGAKMRSGLVRQLGKSYSEPVTKTKG